MLNILFNGGDSSYFDTAFFDNAGEINLDTTNQSATGFTLTNPDTGAVTHMTGSGFTYDADGDPVSGTVTGYSFNQGGGEVASWGGISWDLGTFISALLQLEADAGTSIISSLLSDQDINIDGVASTTAIDMGAMLGTDDLDITSAITVAGSGFDDIIEGDEGRDTLNGLDGNDTMRGGDNDDEMHGGNQEDEMRGGAGDDRMFGGTGFDSLWGGAHNDFMRGGGQADNLFGEEGDDSMYGDQGFDRLFGGDGDDIGFGGTGTDGLFGQVGNDSLYGQQDSDRVFGGVGNDFVDGGSDDDFLFGGAGFDTLVGGTGNDELSGNFNADTFIFADFGGGFGQDTITDFAATNDFERIDLSRVASITDLNDLQTNHMTQVGSDVVIDALGGNTITLSNVNLGDLDQFDFIF